MMDVRPLLDEIENQDDDAKQMSFDELMASESEDEPPPSAAQQTTTRTSAVPGPTVGASSAPVTGRHQDVRLYLTMLLKTYVDLTDAGLVRDMPFEVRFTDDAVYQPDIVFVAHKSFDRVHESYVEGPPDIIVEVLSHGSTALDRGEKFVAYETYRVTEYWLVDPVRELVDLYHLGPEGYYMEFRPDIAGRLRSRVLKGFTLEIDRLWKRVLPKTPEIVEMANEMVTQR